MSSPIFGLSTELFLEIVKLLADEEDSLWRWSRSCRFFRALIVPFLLEAATLRNSIRSANAVLRLARDDKRVHVKSLVFTATSQALSTSHDAGHATNEVFPDAVDEVLSNLRMFPNLRSLTVDIHLEFPHVRMKARVTSFFGQLSMVESIDEMKRAQGRDSWRILMARTYEAIAKNTDSQITSLIIKGLQPSEVSVFSSPAFHAFLGGLQRFDLSFWGTTHRQWQYMNTLRSYQGFRAKLSEFFFNHLKNLTALTLHAHEYSPLGLEGFGHSPLALTEHQMPLLKSVHLSNIFIDTKLVVFFVAHSATLETMSLDECHASTTATGRVTWKDLFAALAQMQPFRLRQFELTPLLEYVWDQTYEEGRVSAEPEKPEQPEAPKEPDEENAVRAEEPEEPEQPEELDEKDAADDLPIHIMFQYKDIKGSIGMVCEDTSAADEMFEKGEDEEAYYKLMEAIRDREISTRHPLLSPAPDLA